MTDRNYVVVSHRREQVFTLPAGGKHVFTADTHYDHANIITYCGRPFLSEDEIQARRDGRDFKPSRASVERMNATLVERINAVVGPEDVLWHLGDVAWHGFKTCKQFLTRLTCQHVNLIWGNHDTADIAELFQGVWEQCLIVVDGRSIHLNHYPHDSWEGSHHGHWHLFGHVHGTRDEQRALNAAWSFSQDVGVDVHDFYPWTLDELAAVFAPREEAWKRWQADWRAKGAVQRPRADA